MSDTDRVFAVIAVAVVVAFTVGLWLSNFALIRELPQTAVLRRGACGSSKDDKAPNGFDRINSCGFATLTAIRRASSRATTKGRRSHTSIEAQPGRRASKIIVLPRVAVDLYSQCSNSQNID